MYNIVGILATIVLVGTVCTLIFAIAAYVVARRRTAHQTMLRTITPSPLSVPPPPPPAAAPRPAATPDRAPSGAGGHVFRSTAPLPPVAEAKPERAKDVLGLDAETAGQEEAPPEGEVYRWK